MLRSVFASNALKNYHLYGSLSTLCLASTNLPRLNLAITNYVKKKKHLINNFKYFLFVSFASSGRIIKSRFIFFCADYIIFEMSK